MEGSEVVPVGEKMIRQVGPAFATVCREMHGGHPGCAPGGQIEAMVADHHAGARG
jgi:hypothetical protein